MNGAQLVPGAALGPPVPPRDIDRYPHEVLVDFRRCSFAALKKYCAKYGLPESVLALPPAEIAGIVGKHFHKQLLVNEETTLGTFCDHVLKYSGGNTLEDLKHRDRKRLRKRPRRGAGAAAATAPASDPSDDEAQSDVEGDMVLYCVCNKGSHGEMVACDNVDCQGGEWFHLSCVGLKEGQVPANWFCPECEKKNNSGETSRRRRTAVRGRRTGEN